MGSLPKEKFAPRFIRKPQLRQEDEGNRLIFECELGGNPKPSITWYRSDEVIDEDDRSFIKIEETKPNVYSVVLELNDVIETDAGLYKVKAKNSFGEVAASINLNFS
ncbi:Projectin, partial [Caligus rogercresseyi]